MNSQSAMQRLLEQPDGLMTPQRQVVWQEFDQIDALVKKRISYRRISEALKQDGKPITASILKKHYEEIRRQRLREARRSKQSAQAAVNEPQVPEVPKPAIASEQGTGAKLGDLPKSVLSTQTPPKTFKDDQRDAEGKSSAPGDSQDKALKYPQNGPTKSLGSYLNNLPPQPSGQEKPRSIPLGYYRRDSEPPKAPGAQTDRKDQRPPSEDNQGSA